MAICWSCKGHIKSETKQLPIQGKPIGQIVNKLDSKANLIFQDSKHNYWFGSRAKGVYRYDGEKITLFTSDDGLVGNHIISVQEDKDGQLYFDSPNGICKYDGHHFEKLEVAETSSSDNWKLEPDDLWFRMGWSNEGPYRCLLYTSPSPRDS